MRMYFSDKLGSKTRALMEIGGDDIAEEISMSRKSDGQELRFMGAKKNSTTVGIFLHSYLTDINVSEWSYRLLLAKETSHIIYLNQQMDNVWNQVTQKYNVAGGNDVKPTLLVTAHYIGDPRLNVPKFGPHFDRVEELLDYAGYWHINLDVAKLNQQGKLTEPDRFALEANIAMANLTISKGLVIPDGNGNFKWKEGIGPFSDEWIVRKTKFKSSQLSSLLSLMEIKGMVKSLDGGMFSI